MGHSRGGITTKIHTLTNSFGLPIKFILTPGETHDVTQASELLSGLKGSYVLADKAYDKDDLLIQIKNEVNAEAVIPPTANRKIKREYDQHIYKDRNMIERAFSRLKNFRRIATRFEKRAQNFMAMVKLGAICVWLS